LLTSIEGRNDVLHLKFASPDENAPAAGTRWHPACWRCC